MNPPSQDNVFGVGTSGNSPGVDSWTPANIHPRYEILREVGRGGMAVVFLAQDGDLGRTVALKVLRPELSASLWRERFLREIRIEAALQHPNVLPIFDSGETDGLLYYTMPYVEGQSLQDRLRQEGPLQIEEAVQITKEIGEALAHAHAHGVVHRDIKPGNILLSNDHAVLADFGIASAMTAAGGEALTKDTLTEGTPTGVAVGTPEYMSPEQVAADECIDGRSDQYALACVLFEMLTGDPPFTGRSKQSVVNRQLSEPPPDLGHRRPKAPAHIARAIGKALSKTPADRYPTVEKFVTDLVEGRSGDSRLSSTWRMLAVSGVVVGTLLGAYWVLRPAETVALDANKVMVFPLAERGSMGGDQGIGYNLALTIEAAVDQTEPLRWLDGFRRLGAAQRSDPASLSVAEVTAISRQAGAASYVTGVVHERTDSVSVVLELWSVEGDSMMAREPVTVARGAADVHVLAIDAVKGLLPVLVEPNRPVDLSPIRNRAAAAIGLWAQAERAYRKSRFADALALYERSLATDSAMALAALGAAQAASWQHLDKTATLAGIAVGLDSLLPQRYALLARGLLAYHERLPDSALIYLERALAMDSAWTEVHGALGELYYHFLPGRARPDSVAYYHLARAVQLDTGFTPPMYHLIEQSARERNVERLTSLMRRYERSMPDSAALLHVRLVRDCALDGPEAVPWDSLSREAWATALSVAQALSVAGANIPCAERGFRSLMDQHIAGSRQRWHGMLGMYGLLMATERQREAAALLAEEQAAGIRTVMLVQTLDALLGQRSEAAADTAARLLERLAAGDYGGMQPHTLLFVGAWSARRHETARAEEIADALARQSRETDDRRPLAYEAAVRGHLAIARGDTNVALREFERATSVAIGDGLTWEFAPPLVVERLLLAELLLSRGRYREAITTAAVFDHPNPLLFLAGLRQSLVIRRDAARSLRDRRSTTEFEKRLARLTEPPNYQP